MDKILLRDVCFIYGKGTPFEKCALDHVNLSIKSGRITGIIGHTGSGKSTMMMLLNGLAKPTSGSVLIDGYDIQSRPQDVMQEWLLKEPYAGMRRSAAKRAIKQEIERRRRQLCFRVGLVMQYPEYQLFEETVYKDIAYGPSNMGLSKEEIRDRVLSAMRQSGLSEKLCEVSPFDLSGGQKRRVAIAGVIAMRPEVLVLDEPAAGLDPQGREQIFGEIRDYQRETGSTVILVSHSMEDMAQYCDDLAVMAHSKMILQGTREEVFAQTDLLETVDLDIPQITKLIQKLRQRGLNLPANIYTVDGAVAALRQLYAQTETGGREE